MTVAAALFLAAAIATPHCVALDRTRPALAATIWLSALALRALTAILVALYVFFFLRASEMFGWITHWCWHAVVPLFAAHLGLNGHDFGDAATFLPALLLSASLIGLLVAVWRTGRAVRLVLARAAVGRGPRNSVLIGGSDVVLAAAGLTRPRLVVSAGALVSLDDAELLAGLDHESAHIERGHRFLLLLAEVCGALARWLPGTRQAVSELRFHLERDADQWAIDRYNDPLALASAICKAAAAGRAHQSALVTLSGGGVARRVKQLLEPPPPAGAPRIITALATGMATLAIAVVAALPPATAAGAGRLSQDKSVHLCVD